MIKSQIKKIRVEKLVDHLLSRGYITLSRKYSKYLPPPQPIYGYDVDVVAKYDEPKFNHFRYERKVAIGITLSDEDLNNPALLDKLIQLTKVHSKYNRKVTVFVGVPGNQIIKADMLISTLDEEVKNKIKLIPLSE